MATVPTRDRVVGRKARKRAGASDVETGSFMVATTMRTAVLGRASEMGLVGAELQQVGARLPKRLILQAKKRTGIDSTTDLILFALANLAVEDDFPQAFIAARGKLDPDLDIGF